MGLESNKVEENFGGIMNSPYSGILPQHHPKVGVFCILTLFCFLVSSCSDLLTDDPVPVAAPNFSPEAGVYNQNQNISITCATANSSIKYTLNGSDPIMSTATTYTEPILIDRSMTIKARAYTSNNSSSVRTSFIELKAATPEFNPPGGNYTSDQTVSITCASPGVTIRYTTNGSEPNSNSQMYSGPITISASSTIKAKAFKQNWTDSDVGSAPYSIRAADPVFSPTGGYYTAAQNIAISSSTSGAQIRYTTNGSVPTSSSTLYTTPITVSSSQVIKAIAMKTGLDNSNIVTHSYGINTVSMPTFNPEPGSYFSAQNVVISCSTPDAIITYTTNGSEPTQTSTQYASPLQISSTTTIKARAYKAGITPSPTATAVYTFGPIFEGFESGNFDSLPWMHPDAVDWQIVSSGEYQGAYCAKSGTIGNNQSTTMQVSVYCNTGFVRFYRKVSSESGDDYLRFYIDDSYYGSWSGTYSWGSAAYYFNPGLHTFKWVYSKDGSSSSGSDCAWIDSISFE